jgi:hypothetical protein
MALDDRSGRSRTFQGIVTSREDFERIDSYNHIGIIRKFARSTIGIIEGVFIVNKPQEHVYWRNRKRHTAQQFERSRPLSSKPKRRQTLHPPQSFRPYQSGWIVDQITRWENLVSGSWNDTIRVWKLDTNECVTTLEVTQTMSILGHRRSKLSYNPSISDRIPLQYCIKRACSSNSGCLILHYCDSQRRILSPWESIW